MPDNRQRQLLTDSTLPDGRMTKRIFPTTSATVHCSRATKEPSPRMYSRAPSLLMMRCSTCLPLYLKSTTSIGRSSSSVQGYSTTSSRPSHNNGNIDQPFRRNLTGCPPAISASTREKNSSLGIFLISYP